jgi:hypothetical protein
LKNIFSLISQPLTRIFPVFPFAAIPNWACNHMSASSFHPAPAGRSTGPRTAAGKAKSSQNAVRHGCCSKKTVFLDDETPEEWEDLKKECIASYDISTAIGEQLAIEVAEELWQLRRVRRQYDNVVQRLYSQRPNMADWLEEDHQAFSRVQRYATAANRSFQRAVAAAECHEKTGIREIQREYQERKSESVRELNLTRAELNRMKIAKIRVTLPPDAVPQPLEEEGNNEDLLESVDFDRRFGPESLLFRDREPPRG